MRARVRGSNRLVVEQKGAMDLERDGSSSTCCVIPQTPLKCQTVGMVRPAPPLQLHLS